MSDVYPRVTRCRGRRNGHVLPQVHIIGECRVNFDTTNLTINIDLRIGIVKVFDESFGSNLLSSSVSLTSLQLTGTNVYEPYIRARPGIAAHLCKVVVLKL